MPQVNEISWTIFSIKISFFLFMFIFLVSYLPSLSILFNSNSFSKNNLKNFYFMILV